MARIVASKSALPARSIDIRSRSVAAKDSAEVLSLGRQSLFQLAVASDAAPNQRSPRFFLDDRHGARARPANNTVGSVLTPVSDRTPDCGESPCRRLRVRLSSGCNSSTKRALGRRPAGRNRCHPPSFRPQSGSCGSTSDAEARVSAARRPSLPCRSSMLRRLSMSMIFT